MLEFVSRNRIFLNTFSEKCEIPDPRDFRGKISLFLIKQFYFNSGSLVFLVWFF